MAETTMVTCRSCGRAFATPLQVDRATLEAMVLNETYECPHCGAVAAYDKSEHFHRLIITDGPEP
jgi:transcription elongation factor Elf1